MNAALSQKFFHRFDGTVWNMVAAEGTLVVEVRTTDPKQVLFSALSIESGGFLWKDRILEEPWWVNAAAVRRDKIIFTVYLDTNNPDRKGILVYALSDLQLLWWNNDFSLSESSSRFLRGFKSKLGLKEVILDLDSGKEVDAWDGDELVNKKLLKKPAQYAEGSAYFDTVKTFLADRLNFAAVSSLEYLEAENRIVISAYTAEEDRLANYLFVLSAEGNVLLKEKLEGQVQGIGLDTFFVLQGCLIFVRNKVELISYKI